MGASVFKDSMCDKRISGMLEEFQPAIASLNINCNDVELIRKEFQKIDVDSLGVVRFQDLESLLTIERIPFNRKVLAMFVDNNQESRGELDILEFLLVIYNYCSMDAESLGETNFMLVIL